MNRNIAIAFLGLCFVVGGIVRVEAQGAATGDKVAFVDLQSTLNQTKAGKAAKKRLEATKKKKQDELNKEQKALQTAAEQLQKQQAILKPEALAKKQQELQQKYAQLEETYRKLQRSLVEQESALVKEIFGKAAPVIQQIAKQKGYSMVVDKSMVLWAKSELDITAAVNKRLK